MYFAWDALVSLEDENRRLTLYMFRDLFLVQHNAAFNKNVVLFPFSLF